jgi:cell division protein FtsQ
VPELSIRGRRIVALTIVGAVGLALAGWALTYTPLFQARHIRVLGAQTLSPAQVRARAGVDGSTNVVHTDTGEIAARLLQDAWIASASVRRDLPDTLVLDIVERRPLAVIQAMGETSVLASDGSELPATTGKLAGLPTMRAALGAPDETQRLAVADLLLALDPVVGQRVRAVTVGQDKAVTLTFRDGVAVLAGTPGNEAQKGAALRAVLRWAAAGAHDLATIDVSAPSAPSATLVNGSSVTP